MQVRLQKVELYANRLAYGTKNILVKRGGSRDVFVYKFKAKSTEHLLFYRMLEEGLELITITPFFLAGKHARPGFPARQCLLENWLRQVSERLFGIHVITPLHYWRHFSVSTTKYLLCWNINHENKATNRK